MVLVKSHFSTTPPKANLDANKLKVAFELQSMCPFFLTCPLFLKSYYPPFYPSGVVGVGTHAEIRIFSVKTLEW